VRDLPHDIYRTLEDSTALSTAKHMRVRISLPSYKIVYESGTEDLVFRSRMREEEEMLRERSQGREEDRRKSRWLS
jgi:paired amphipathic helix protein Sin3a